MKPCCKCGTEIGFGGGYTDKGKRYCPDCWYKKKESPEEDEYKDFRDGINATIKKGEYRVNLICGNCWGFHPVFIQKGVPTKKINFSRMGVRCLKCGCEFKGKFPKGL